MNKMSRIKQKIRLPVRQISGFDSIDDGLSVEEYLSEIRKQINDTLKNQLALDPTEVTISTDIGEYYMRYIVHASLMETDEQFVCRMDAINKLEEQEARLVEEAKIIKSLAYDDELGEYIRLRDKFKLYEFDK